MAKRSNNMKRIILENRIARDKDAKFPHACGFTELSDCIDRKYKESVAADYLGKLANGRFEPNVYTATMIADCLGRPLGEVFGLEA